MSIKDVILVGIGLFVLSGCEMDFNTFKKEYLSSEKNVSLKYGSVNGIEISDEDIDFAREILNINDEFDGLEKALKEEIIELIVEKRLLAQHSISVLKSNIKFNTKLEQIKKELALNMWVEKETLKFEEEIKEADFETFYEKNKNLFLIPKQYKLRHIVLKDEEKMNEIFQKLSDINNTLENFSMMAKENSIDGTSEIGGDLGWIELEGLIPGVQEVIINMKINQVSRLENKTELGFHIFYLEDFKESNYMKLELVKEDIKEILIKEKVDNLMAETVKKLKKSAEVKITILK